MYRNSVCGDSRRHKKEQYSNFHDYSGKIMIVHITRILGLGFKDSTILLQKNTTGIS